MPRQAHARFTFLIDPDTKREFEAACAAQDLRPSQLMRHMIKAHIAATEAAKRPPPPNPPSS